MATWVSPLANTNQANGVTLHSNSGGIVFNSTDIKAKVANIECAVCGDKSSGKHYGVFTCEGCKSFFKRSIRRNLAYSCRAYQNCPVDINHRNQCQFCRLKKCVKVGMRKDAVQKGRIPRSPIEGSMVDQLVGMNNQVHGNHTHHISTYTNLLLRADNIARLQLQQQQQQQQQSSFTIPTSMNSIPSDINMQETATRLLLNAVEWARNVPFFSALPTTDQMALLKSCWSELYILSTSQHCVTYQLTARNLSPLNIGDQNDQRKRMTYDDNFSITNDYYLKLFEELVEKFKHLQTDPAEFSCLKALVLFNPDSPGIGNPSLIESLQEKAQGALEEYLRHHTSSNYANRFGKLLLRLPALSLIRPTTIESLFFSRIVGNHTVDSLIGSMLIYGSNSNNNIPIINGGMQTNMGYNIGVNPNNINTHLNNLTGLGLINPNFNISHNNNVAINNAVSSMNNLQNGLQNSAFNGIQIPYQQNTLNNGPYNVGIMNPHAMLNMNRPSGNTCSEGQSSPQKQFVKTESPPR